MTRSSDLEREHRALRERLSRLGEAGLRINESPEVRHCLPGGAGRRASRPSGANSGVSTLFNDSAAGGRVPASGTTPEEVEGVKHFGDGRPQRPPGGPSLLATSGVMGGTPSANSSRKPAFTRSGAPRM